MDPTYHLLISIILFYFLYFDIMLFIKNNKMFSDLIHTKLEHSIVNLKKLK